IGVCVSKLLSNCFSISLQATFVKEITAIQLALSSQFNTKYANLADIEYVFPLPGHALTTLLSVFEKTISFCNSDKLSNMFITIYIPLYCIGYIMWHNKIFTFFCITNQFHQ